MATMKLNDRNITIESAYSVEDFRKCAESDDYEARKVLYVMEEAEGNDFPDVLFMVVPKKEGEESNLPEICKDMIVFKRNSLSSGKAMVTFGLEGADEDAVKENAYNTIGKAFDYLKQVEQQYAEYIATEDAKRRAFMAALEA